MVSDMVVVCDTCALTVYDDVVAQVDKYGAITVIPDANVKTVTAHVDGNFVWEFRFGYTTADGISAALGSGTHDCPGL